MNPILIVEDEAPIRELIRLVLAPLGRRWPTPPTGWPPAACWTKTPTTWFFWT